MKVTITYSDNSTRTVDVSDQKILSQAVAAAEVEDMATKPKPQPVSVKAAVEP